MSAHAENRPTSQEHGQAGLVKADPLSPPEVREEALEPPADYSVGIRVRTPPAQLAPPPLVAPQPSAPLGASRLESEKVVVAAPFSFAGSAQRIWKLVGLSGDVWARVLLGALAVFLIGLAWIFVLTWYLFWGIWLIPYRLIRRGSRKRKQEALQHRETIAAIQGGNPAPPTRGQS